MFSKFFLKCTNDTIGMFGEEAYTIFALKLANMKTIKLCKLNYDMLL